MRKLASELSTRFRVWRLKGGSTPENEFKAFRDEVARNSWSLDQTQLVHFYHSHCLDVVPDAYAPEIAERICSALAAGQPLSVIRIGDGEANLLRCRRESPTNHLDRKIARKSILNQSDRFIADDDWLRKLGSWMENSIREADIVVVLGLWPHTGVAPSVEKILSRFEKNRRGVAGNWYGRQEMCGLAQDGILRDKIVGSAHLYLGAVVNLRKLLEASDRIICMTDKDVVVTKIANVAGDKEVLHVPVGRQASDMRPPDDPSFLEQTEAMLPEDLAGTLVLIGAGVWAEFYVGKVKQRGGVGVDIGSGFDLLAGRSTRLIHKYIPNEVQDKIANWDTEE